MHIPAGSEFKTVLGIVSTFGFALSCPRALADEPGGLSPVVNPISKGIYDLHMVILWVCVAIVIGVFGAMIYSIIRHRKSRGEAAANFHKNPTTEYIWAGIPFAILILMAIPATKTLLTLQDSRQADLSIKVTGYECKWKYDYLEEKIGFFSALPSGRDEMVELSSDNETEVLEVDNPVVVPTHQKIRFLLTSSDVPRLWWVPELDIKQEAVPGAIIDRWAKIQKPGIYRGKRGMECAPAQQAAPIVIIAKTKREYREWIEAKKTLSQDTPPRAISGNTNNP